MSASIGPRRAGDLGPRLVRMTCHAAAFGYAGCICRDRREHDYALKVSAPPADGDHVHTTKLPVEWNNAIHGAAKQEADAAGMVELDVEIAWARATGEIPAPANPSPPAIDAKEARRRARLEKRIRAVFAATGMTAVGLVTFARHSVSRKAVYDAEAAGVLAVSSRGGYRLVRL